METGLISVLVADDQDIVADGLRMMIDSEPDLHVVGVARNGDEALTAVRDLAPDVVLMDIQMPVVDGIEATRRLAASGCDSRVLILTTFNLDEYVYLALRAGAAGFLLKDARREELTHAIRVVHQGDAILAPDVTRRLIEEFCGQPTPGTTAPQHSLSDREIEVVQRLARGLSNAEVAAELYLSEATVKSHVARILAKLGLRDRLQTVVYAYETGLVRPGHPEK